MSTYLSNSPWLIRPTTLPLSRSQGSLLSPFHPSERLLTHETMLLQIAFARHSYDLLLYPSATFNVNPDHLTRVRGLRLSHDLTSAPPKHI
jgi:hypothetical protein